MGSSSTPLLVFEDVDFWYDPARKLFEQFTWQVARGESWSILGPSGCGKSTLLYLIAGLRRPCRGRVWLDGKEINGPNPAVGLMLQDYGLLNWYSAARNIELGLQIRGLARRERATRRDHWLQELDINHIRDQYPLQLSGGQRQRVALARLLALQAPIQLLDEPLAAVDELTRERLQGQLVRINRELGASTLTVTHNVEEAVLLGDKVLVITDHTPITEVHTEVTTFAAPPQRDDPAFIAACRAIRRRLAGASEERR